ncbi:GNAT family N-acetyltransferase [Pelagibacterium lentulum]|uniref:N-acetyltransferase n=1 Tax=Pelagibacterium lentulum TaxID=2029865 RepID=A0A916R678_9HYPH|nr:GNAT family N-acetyltransferase [Pelagibacterium lentulum]GGA36628.1 N-acetyltransferase [Pelagibacterium lentulum]
MNTFSLTLTDNPEPERLKALGDNLMDFNDADVGSAQRRLLAIFIDDEAGALKGGLYGQTGWGWLYVQWLWLDQDARGQGMAGQLLAKAEVEARARGCHSAHIDTFNPLALKVYLRAGYEVFGVLEDFPQGRTRSFLKKRLMTD